MTVRFLDVIEQIALRLNPPGFGASEDLPDALIRKPKSRVGLASVVVRDRGDLLPLGGFFGQRSRRLEARPCLDRYDVSAPHLLTYGHPRAESASGLACSSRSVHSVKVSLRLSVTYTWKASFILACEICLEGIDPAAKLPRLVWIQAAVQVAVSGSFASAGRELNKDGDTIGQSVRMLEDHLGEKLFHRTRVSATPTKFGRAILMPLAEALTKISVVASR